MRRKEQYRLGQTIALRGLREIRELEERERERYFSDFSHHINPMRELEDVVHFDIFVTSGRELSTAEKNALKAALEETFERFHHCLENRLREIRAVEKTSEFNGIK